MFRRQTRAFEFPERTARVSHSPRPRPCLRVTPCPRKRRLLSDSNGVTRGSLRVTEGGFCPTLSQLSSTSAQAELEESGASLRVTRARSCPTFPGLLAAGQQLPSGSLRVTSPPRPRPLPPRRPPGEAQPGAAAHGTPAAADARRLESPAGPSRDANARCARIAQRGTPLSSSAGFLQLVDAADTTHGRTDISSAHTSSPFASQSVVHAKRGRRPTIVSETKRVGLF